MLLEKKAIVKSQSASISRNSAVLLSLKEGFQIFERDLSKLQVTPYLYEIPERMLMWIAIYRTQRYWLRESPEKMGQAFKVSDKRIVSITTS